MINRFVRLMFYVRFKVCVFVCHCGIAKVIIRFLTYLKCKGPMVSKHPDIFALYGLEINLIQLWVSYPSARWPVYTHPSIHKNVFHCPWTHTWCFFIIVHCVHHHIFTGLVLHRPDLQVHLKRSESLVQLFKENWMDGLGLRFVWGSHVSPFGKRFESKL